MVNAPEHVVHVLRALRDSHHAPALRVFGSAASGSFLANDVDVAIDLRGLTAPASGISTRYDTLQLRSEIEKQYAQLLALARRHYGRLDPFLITDRGLYARNSQATAWLKAIRATALIEAIETTSLPLAHALALYGVKAKTSQFDGPMVEPNFRRWFGQSKAVNPKTGEPMVLFHGTGADVGPLFRPGTYFTALPHVADIYAKAPTRQTDGAGPNVSPVFLSVQNPYIFDDAVINDNLGHHILGKRSKLDAIFAKLACDGHDGLFIKNYLDLGGIQDQYVIFQSSQTRTAVGWHCEFDRAPAPAQMELLDTQAPTEPCHG